MLGVHVGDLVGGGNLVFSEKLCNGFGLNLNLELGNKVDFDFVVENCVKSTIENPSRSPCQSLFKKWSLLLFSKHVKDDLDAPLKANVHISISWRCFVSSNGCTGAYESW